MIEPRSGLIVLFGSGETSPSGGRVFEAVAQRLAARLRVAILETPAGFEPNSDLVARRVGEFLDKRLQNYQPQVTIVPARQRGTRFSPDDAALLEPLLAANLLFLGPGSPTYAARQLHDSLAWHLLLARHRLGAALALASAAVCAVSRHVLPVYEIYKAGEDLHWRGGLDLFARYGLALTFVPHWNNAEGGADLDTSHCYMGRERYLRLRALLPKDMTLVGIDEHTALVVDLQAARAEVMGRGGVTLERDGQVERFPAEAAFPLSALGTFQPAGPAEVFAPAPVWERAWQAEAGLRSSPEAPAEVLGLARDRQAARERKDWATADILRARITALGWTVLDTPAGSRLEPL